MGLANRLFCIQAVFGFAVGFALAGLVEARPAKSDGHRRGQTAMGLFVKVEVAWRALWQYVSTDGWIVDQAGVIERQVGALDKLTRDPGSRVREAATSLVEDFEINGFRRAEEQ